MVEKAEDRTDRIRRMNKESLGVRICVRCHKNEIDYYYRTGHYCPACRSAIAKKNAAKRRSTA